MPAALALVNRQPIPQDIGHPALSHQTVSSSGYDGEPKRDVWEIPAKAQRPNRTIQGVLRNRRYLSLGSVLDI